MQISEPSCAFCHVLQYEHSDEQQLQKQREELPLFCEQILDLMLELGTAAATKTDPGEANSKLESEGGKSKMLS